MKEGAAGEAVGGGAAVRGAERRRASGLEWARGLSIVLSTVEECLPFPRFTAHGSQPSSCQLAHGDSFE